MVEQWEGGEGGIPAAKALQQIFQLELLTDSTIAPPPKETAIFFNENVSWLLDTRKDTTEIKAVSHIVSRVQRSADR